jgi:hypothetical protein
MPNSSSSAVEAPPPIDPRGLDERRIATGVAIGLPLVTLSVAAVIGILMGPATSILVIAAGVLLGVIAILWASIRILSGDAPLSPEVEALDSTSGVGALDSKKFMLLRALKDLENEHAIGKIEDDDFAAIAGTYRRELKTVLRQMDMALDPHRARAEEAIRSHLIKAGLVAPGYRGEQAPPERESDRDVDPVVVVAKPMKKSARLACSKCGESNEPDAKFCKGCATNLREKEATDAS